MRTDEIRARLDAATPGRWHVETVGNTVKSYCVVSRHNGVVNHPVCSSISPKTGNAAFIASAPADIAYLLDENAVLRKVLEMGISNACSATGIDMIGCPPHTGSCERCTSRFECWQEYYIQQAREALK